MRSSLILLLATWHEANEGESWNSIQRASQYSRRARRGKVYLGSDQIAGFTRAEVSTSLVVRDNYTLRNRETG